MEHFDTCFQEGFAKAAAELGASPEELRTLLKVATIRALCASDPEFAAGFKAELEKSGQHFWRNVAGGAGVGALAGSPFGGPVGAGIGAVVGGIAGGVRGATKNINDPQNVANKYNQQRNQWMQKRQQTDQMYGMGPGGWPRPGFGSPMPQRWSGGYGYPGWY